ncbi:MAG: S8 family serine peptidase [Flavobacteriaceae bacterium]|nr:S8 family serine peptidase [Flavobacteriaceae bacterium]
MMKQLWCLLFIFLFTNSTYSQEYSWFYIRAKDTLFQPEFRTESDQIKYAGSNSELASILDRYKIFEFKKTFKNVRRTSLKKTFFVVANNKKLLKDLLNLDSKLFDFGELIEEEDKKIYEPNDYGSTSTIGENVGFQAYLDYYDVLGMSKAWYYTTGDPETIIGISDGLVDTSSTAFQGKTTLFRKSSKAKGHGDSVAATAAGQGDNGFGFPGVCFNCNIYSTSFGHSTTLITLLEMSRAGAKVINCSWGSTRYSQTAQDAIYEMIDNGTFVVAIAHNKPWKDAKGLIKYYPASYDKVISVATVMHRYESVFDNILKEKKNGKYYAANIRGHLGRTMGFKDNDTLNDPHIYPISIRTLNKEVDIVGPGVGLVRFGEYTMNNKLNYSTYGATSGIAPLITGTVGLMVSLQPCLTFNEVDAILKMTSTNIDHIKANKPWAGLYGSGMLHTGNAVELVYKLMTESETSYIENQDFYRWSFPITSFSKETVIRNQTFRDDAVFNLTAKNKIVISENTVLSPNSNGNISLKIDTELEKECELKLREGFPNNKYYKPSN